MKQQLTKYKNILIPVFSIILGLGVLGVLIIPTILNIPKTDSQIADLTAKKSTLDKKISVLDQVNVDNYQSDIATSLYAIPVEKSIPSSFTQLLFLVQTNGLSLDDISFSTGQVGKNVSPTALNSYLVKLSISGPSEGLLNFTNKLKEVPRIFKIQSIDVSAGSQNATIQAGVDVSTFFQGLNTTLGSADSPVTIPSDKDRAVLDKIRQFMANLPQESTGSAVTGPSGKPDPFQ